MDLSALRTAASDRTAVQGYTHTFYRYPARFSPKFAATAIECFSRPGDLVCDPFMGGGTTVVESLLAGRCVVGTDVNSLSVFITKAKTTPLKRAERLAVEQWAQHTAATTKYHSSRSAIASWLDDPRSRNLTLPWARVLKKAIAYALSTVNELPTHATRQFSKCVILRTAQWALDNRKRVTRLAEFRERLLQNTYEMLLGIVEFGKAARKRNYKRPITLQYDAARIDTLPVFRRGRKVDLVIASPPYPGVHMLYHRWQVNGRRETPAPYWIADCQDGHGTSFYTFGDRRIDNLDNYFDRSLSAFSSIRRIVRRNGILVQMVAFSDPNSQLPRYLETLEYAGFCEVDREDQERIWRDVPNRKWHATFKGNVSSAREVVLVHSAK